jgi:serine phosphatase RsbU (regulator of sigma subunit)
MDALRELTAIIEDLSEAGSFKEAAELLTRWARTFTGCQAAILRLVEDGDDGPWLAGCALDGPSVSFARDETVVCGSDCICGRVATEIVDRRLPFYTEGGSFYWGRIGSLEQEFTLEQLGPLRGRCIEEKYESVAVFPLRAGERVVGSLHLADARPDHFIGSVEVLESVCRLAGGILLRHKAEEREHALLDAVQTALLPPTPPKVEGLSIGVSFGSATAMARLGGDFYDVLDLGGAGILLLVGDVCGRGVEAAGMATRARWAIEAHASLASDPASFMSPANEALLQLMPSHRFVTAVACLIDPCSGSLITCLAGHPSPLRLTYPSGARHGGAGRRGAEPGGAKRGFAGRGGAGRSATQITGTEIEAPHNPPLGLFAGLRFAEATEGLAQDDVLLIYTDGVSDSRRGGALFGPEGIVRVVGEFPDQDPEAIARLVCATAAGYHDPSLPSDDRLVMAVRLRGGC